MSFADHQDFLADEVRIPRVTVAQVEEKWGVFVDGILIGTSKARFDADHAREVLLRLTEK